VSKEFDLLEADLPDPDDTSAMSPRQRRRVERTKERLSREAKKQTQREKVRQARKAPRSGLALLIVGVLFFGGIFLIGSLTARDGETSVPLLTYPADGVTDVPASGEPSPTAATFQDAATEWARAYFGDDGWQEMTADEAEADLTAMRMTYFEPAPGSFLTGETSEVADFGFRDVAQSADGTWSGNVDVLFGGNRDIPVASSLLITMTPDAGLVLTVTTTFYGQV